MQQQPPVRWAPGQVALVAAAVILAVVVGTTLLGLAGVLPESAAAAISGLFLAACGAAAGMVGARRRGAQLWPAAVTAYRVATWCFFLAALHALKFHFAAEGERQAHIQDALKQYQEQQRNDTSSHRAP